MKLTFARLFLVASAFCLLAAGCHSREPEVWRAGDPAYVPAYVTALVLSADNRFAALSLNRSKKSRGDLGGKNENYVLDLTTGRHRKFVSDTRFVKLPEGHGFVLIHNAFQESDDPVLLVDGLETTKSFNLGEHYGGWLNPKTQTMIFETGWQPTQGEGADRIGLLNLHSGKVASVQLLALTEWVTFYPLSGNFYTADYTGEPKADEYDPEGKRIRESGSDLVVYSATCR